MTAFRSIRQLISSKIAKRISFWAILLAMIPVFGFVTDMREWFSPDVEEIVSGQTSEITEVIRRESESASDEFDRLNRKLDLVIVDKTNDSPSLDVVELASTPLATGSRDGVGESAGPEELATKYLDRQKTQVGVARTAASPIDRVDEVASDTTDAYPKSGRNDGEKASNPARVKKHETPREKPNPPKPLQTFRAGNLRVQFVGCQSPGSPVCKFEVRNESMEDVGIFVPQATAYTEANRKINSRTQRVDMFDNTHGTIPGGLATNFDVTFEKSAKVFQVLRVRVNDTDLEMRNVQLY